MGPLLLFEAAGTFEGTDRRIVEIDHLRRGRLGGIGGFVGRRRNIDVHLVGLSKLSLKEGNVSKKGLVKGKGGAHRSILETPGREWRTPGSPLDATVVSVKKLGHQGGISEEDRLGHGEITADLNLIEHGASPDL